MTLSLRPFLVTFLVLLQFIAPLVHAHTSEQISSQGVHIPGLEAYGRSIPPEALEATQSATTVLCKMSVFCSHIEGQVVGVDAGFSRDLAMPMQRLYKIIADLHSDTYLASPPAVFKTRISVFATTLPIFTVPLVSQLANSAHPARAPPVHV
ncbi:MAG: hypothetical protein LUP96_01080 [Methylococcaceae bacterium]|nr:hypothetical protein [Methylococcaceae bacterium]MDD1615712.1 hypothetical protein [Methylococcaceae bacterium]OYV19621.1 MAG: hypothetical protein CG439_808 [Methylococcaceae bacterium NSP1-2]